MQPALSLGDGVSVEKVHVGGGGGGDYDKGKMVSEHGQQTRKRI